MRTSLTIARAGTLPPRRQLAFTLPELTVSMAIFTFMLLGVFLAVMVGLRYDSIVTSKMGASEKSRMSFDQLTADVRECKSCFIGTGSLTGFIRTSNMTAQVGNAVQVSYDSNQNTQYIRYWFDTNRAILCRSTSDNSNSYTIIARSLTNASGQGMTFRKEDYAGNLLLDLTQKHVVVTTMEFYEYQYPITRVGPGNYYDYYRIQIKAASHAPN